MFGLIPFVLGLSLGAAVSPHYAPYPYPYPYPAAYAPYPYPYPGWY